MKRFFLLFLLSLLGLSAFCQDKDGASQYICGTVAQLLAYKGAAASAIVTDKKTGGMFYYTAEKQKVDNGIVYQGQNNGFWVRMYNDAEPVNISWFRVVDCNGIRAMKAALEYNSILINDTIDLTDNLTIPEEKNISFTKGGFFKTDSSHSLTINGNLKAGDYQSIFLGDGKVSIGAKATRSVSACWFGAVADCRSFAPGKGKDNLPAIQKAIDAATNVSDLYLPPTSSDCFYRISGTINLTKKLHFFSFNFHGGGTTVTRNKDDMATTIFADFSDGSAINIQGSRRLYISNLVLYGRNTRADDVWKNGVTNTPAADTADTYASQGIKKSYAAITTDVEKDSKTWTADVIMDNILINYFYLGIGVSQAGNLQGDRIRIINSQINNCVYGVSLGNPQNKACHFENLDMNYIYCAYTTTTFGKGTGCLFQVTGGQICHCYKLFNIRPYYLGQCSIAGLYAEAIGSIGEIGSGTVHSNSVVFTGCCFQIRDGSVMTDWAMYAKYYSLTSFANISFVGCNFWVWRPFLAMYAGTDDGTQSSQISFSGCSFYHAGIVHVSGNSSFENSYFLPYGRDLTMNSTLRGVMDTPARFTISAHTDMMTSLRDDDGATNNKPGTFTKLIVRKIPKFFKIAKAGDVRILSKKRDTVVINYSQQLADSFFRYVRAGDWLGSTIKNYKTFDNPDMVVLKIDGDQRQATVEMLTDQIRWDTLCIMANQFVTTMPVSAQLNEGDTVARVVSNIRLLRAGDIVTFKDATHVYRIKDIDVDKGELVFYDKIREDIHKETGIYNALLVDASAIGEK